MRNRVAGDAEDHLHRPRFGKPKVIDEARDAGFARDRLVVETAEDER